MVLDGKPSREYSIKIGVSHGSIRGHTLFLVYINDLPHDVIRNIDIYANDTTLCSKLDQLFDVWQQLELTSQHESDLRDTMDFLISMLEKLNWFHLTGENNTGVVHVKMDESVLDEKSYFKIQRLTFSSKLDWGSYITSIAETASKKIGKFFPPELALHLYKSTMPVVMSGLALLVATCNCWISYKNEYA